MGLIEILTLCVVILALSLFYTLYKLFRFSMILIGLEDAVEECLDLLDERYKTRLKGKIFYDNEKVLCLSTHQYPFYPGTGSDKEKGNHNNIFNVPLPAGTNTEKYMNALDKVLDKLVEFKPEFLIFSMGFDANIADPLAQFELKSEDFYEITRRTLKATNEFTKGKVISVLEGGYDLNALAESAFNHVNALTENKV